jgi:uncharacterized phage protein (TIGR01671 family)
LNRQLKFRAWDTKTKKFLETGFHIFGEVTCFDLIGQHLAENLCGAKTSLERLNDVRITQFTGLLDKNGKEVYEGDVLNVGEIVAVKFGKYYDHEGFLSYGYYLEFKSGNCYDLIQYVCYPDAFDDCSIIGNIFENPELLNEPTN